VINRLLVLLTSLFSGVDYGIQKNKNGSATMWIGEVELRDRMRFMPGVSVYPGKSYFEVTFRPLNPTSFANSILFFANVSVHLQTAVDRITNNHTKARDGEAYYYLGVCRRFQ